MNKIREVVITLDDLEDVRLVLNAALNYFVSKDVAEAQQQLRVFNRSPLTVEIERVKNRMDGYLSDFLLLQHEEEHGIIEEEYDEAIEENLAEQEEEELLSSNPLGTVQFKRQQGRRLSKKELEKDE